MKTFLLHAGDAVAEIAARGAEARGWMVAGRPLLWRADPAFWSDTAPILFPIVGWTNGGQIRVGATSFPLGLHGFARHSDFAATREAPASLRLELASTPFTMALYPFEFRLSVDYVLSETALRIVLTVSNCGQRPMPYACGLHPGFSWPFAGGSWADYRILFETPEEPWIPEISDRGLFLPSRRRVPLCGCELPLSTELFAREALCFLEARSRSVRFAHETGAAITVEAENFSHWALWSRPGAPFLSIETWTGYGDPQEFAGDLFEKPSMRLLPPGREVRHAATYRYTPDGR